VMESAVRYCRAESIVEICESWVAWLEREAPTRNLDQYQISVVDILTPATRRDPQLRRNMMARMLALPGTSNVMYVVSDLIGLWNDLRSDERALVCALLGSGRTDALWLKAVVLTRNSVPAELQKQILGKPDALSASADDLLGNLDPKLLLAAIAVQCGRPNHFWNIAHSSKLFDKIARLIELRSSHPAFEIAFQEAVFGMDDSRVSRIIEAVQEDDLEKVFQMMLCERVEWTGNLLSNSWAKLLSRGTQDQREDWFNRMAKAAPACVDDLEEAMKWLAREGDRAEFVRRLPSDSEAHLLALHLTKATGSKRSGLIERLTDILGTNPPILYATYDTIRGTLQAQRIGSRALWEQIEQLRRSCLDERESIKEQFQKGYFLPEGWIG